MHGAPFVLKPTSLVIFNPSDLQMQRANDDTDLAPNEQRLNPALNLARQVDPTTMDVVFAKGVTNHSCSFLLHVEWYDSREAAENISQDLPCC